MYERTHVCLENRQHLLRIQSKRLGSSADIREVRVCCEKKNWKNCTEERKNYLFFLPIDIVPRWTTDSDCYLTSIIYLIYRYWWKLVYTSSKNMWYVIYDSARKPRSRAFYKQLIPSYNIHSITMKLWYLQMLLFWIVLYTKVPRKIHIGTGW